MQPAQNSNHLIEAHMSWIERKEIPCKDLDFDCLPGDDDTVPFGSYTRCFAYDSEQGICPFVPFGASDK